MTTVAEIRKSKRELMEEFFEARIGQPVSSMDLHLKFGSSARSRISDINKDEKAKLTIRNECRIEVAKEISFYTAERRVRNAAVQLEMGLLGGKHEQQRQGSNR